MKRNMNLGLSLAIIVALLAAPLVFASDWAVAVVDVTAPTDSVTLAPGGSAAIVIDISVTGNQVGTATFKVYRDWTLSGGTFTGSNAAEFTVEPRAGGDPATNFSTNGTITVAAGQADGTFTLEAGVFNITNTNDTGAKLDKGVASSYEVIVEAPAGCTYEVVGFHSPVKNTNSGSNSVKGGSTVPLKFNAFCDGEEVTDPEEVTVFTQTIGCVAGVGEDLAEYATGNTSLRYDGVPGDGGQFIFNWKTPKNGCYRVTVGAGDASIFADFQLK
jgi:hypothetical protein